MPSTVLIVEDQAGFRMVYRDLLSSNGFKVLEAADGELGWETARAKIPDLVLLDVNMPKLTGFEVLKRLRGEDSTRNIPVIICSVNEDFKSMSQGFHAGANDYLIKGVDSLESILTKINTLISKTKGPTQFLLSVAEGQGDAARLAREAGLADGFQCPQCRAKVSVELIRAPDRKFQGRLVCPKCNQSF